MRKGSVNLPPPSQPVQIDLTCDVRRSLTGVLFCKSTISLPPDKEITLVLPKWMQHFHAPRGPIEAIAGLKVTAGGESVAWCRDAEDPYRFELQTNRKLSEVTLEYQLATPTRSRDGRIVASSAMGRVQWSNLTLYPEGFAPDEIEVVASLLLPDGWTADGALKRAEKICESVRYEQVDLRRFLDSPILCGAHCKRAQFAEGVRAAFFADDPGMLPCDPEHLAAHARLVGEVDALFGGRPFDEYVFLLAMSKTLGLTGLEHRHSSENGVRSDYFIDWENSITERDLLPHEYIHAWCGKYRTPKGSMQEDFQHALTNELMWVYEGFTQYYGHVIAARCGLISPQATIEAFAQIALTYDTRAGREWRPLDDTNHDPIINAREPRPWQSWQRSEDYYSEGAMIWLEADMLIRSESGGEKSLDDFALAFFKPEDPEGPPKPYDFDDLVAALESVWSHDWAKFLRKRTFAIAEKVSKDGFEMGGYRLVWNSEAMRWSVCDQKHHSYCDLMFSVGMKIGLNDKIIEVAWGSPAFDVDLAKGAQILELNGGDYSHDAIRDAVDSASPSGSPLKLKVRQAGTEREVTLDWEVGNRFPGVEPIDGAEDHLGQALVSRVAT